MRHVHRASSIRPAEPGTWVAVLGGQSRSAIVVCECRALISLTDYTIGNDGTISDHDGAVLPLVQCPYCGSTEQFVLVDWPIAA